MGCRSTITQRDLERMLCDETTEPKALPLSLLEEITDGFSDKHQIGIGGFAVVYKGKLQNRIVAVKRMSNAYMDEKVFHREVQCLMMAKHKNIVRFLGYCADRQGSMQEYEGKLVMADVHQRLLCFEYLPKGSLHEYITDTSSGLQWRDRYRIIKGVCQGLHYLHQNNIVHLDLKPTNILLDDNLVAKIADFGLSRRFSEMQSRVITVNIGGTLGYLAPEFANGEITYQFDIYSLGVIIIEILTGKKGYHAVDNVVGSWSNVMGKSQRDVQIEQVRVCAEIGIECTNFNPAKRPDMQYVINRFAERDTMDGYIDTDVITSQQAEHDPKKLHRDMPNTPGGASSEDNTTAVTVAETNPYNKFWENTAKPDMLNEKMDALWCRYQQLNPDIRQCLGYCSIFPKKAVLHMDNLVALWMAQGFVKTSCATKDMEDTAEGYIQELVSYSFLQPGERRFGEGRCVTIPDMLHDLLDKVAGNCLRIENARNQIGEAWEGYVPQDVQHLLIQNYDAELITEKILGLQNLLTLIVYVVKDAPVEERVIESICKRLPKLRVLAVAFSDKSYCDKIWVPRQLPVPESISELHHLCYLAFRIREYGTVSLPSTINKLQHIQFLDFGEGDTGEFSFGDHVNLRYLIRGLPSAYDNVLRRSFQMLRPMVVMNKQGNNGIKQLRDLNKLCGWLYIIGLQELKSKDEALEVNLAAKERLTKLRLEWSLGCSVSLPWGIRKVQADVLEGLCPPAGLQTLKIFNYEASRYPDWMMGKVNDGPKGLQKLELQSWTQLGPAPQLVEAFPHLRKLTIWYCTWHTLPSNMEHLTSLGKLDIHTCKNIRSLPTLPQSLDDFTLGDCNDEFMKSCQTIGHPNWQKIEHVCIKSFL